MPETTLSQHVKELQDWRLLVVDPKLAEHDKKIDNFEAIAMQITGVVKFVKIVATFIGIIAGVCELARAVAPYLHKLS